MKRGGTKRGAWREVRNRGIGTERWRGRKKEMGKDRVGEREWRGEGERGGGKSLTISVQLKRFGVRGRDGE